MDLDLNLVQIASLFDMYMNIGAYIAGKQDGLSLIIGGLPNSQMCKKYHIVAHT